MEVQTEIHLTPLPPKPSCVVWYKGSPCDVLIQQYNQAVQQRSTEGMEQYANQQRSQAAAPLQQQLADQQERIENLRQLLQAQNAAALIAEGKAQAEGVQEGAMFGFGAALVLFAIFFGVRKLFKRFSITKKPQARAASPEGATAQVRRTRQTHASDRPIELVDWVVNRYHRMSGPDPTPRALHRPKPQN